MIALHARRVLTADGPLADAHIRVADGKIVDVGRGAPVGCVALGDVDVIPGLVDLHSDCLEERAHPRPGRDQPLLAALLGLDLEAAAHGVTTHHLCATVEDDPFRHRSTDRAVEVVRCVAQWRERLRVDHRVHLRVELTSDGYAAARELAALPAVTLISYMHHAPGYGQYANDPDAWRRFYATGFRGTDAELHQLVVDRRARSVTADQGRSRVAEIAADTDTVLVSHDDTSGQDARDGAAMGVAISEFPLSLEAAEVARELGVGVVMGAPNAWRGGSHLQGSLAARDVLADGQLTALASDYHPPSLLAAVYALADEGLMGFAEAVELVCGGPAALAGLDDRGTIAPGRRADLVAVQRVGGHPVVAQTWVAGRPVLGAGLLD